MDTVDKYKIRLLNEYRNLVEKRTLLESVVNSEHTSSIDSKQMEIMRKQFEFMMGYEECLYSRILEMMK